MNFNKYTVQLQRLKASAKLYRLALNKCVAPNILLSCKKEIVQYSF